MCPTRIFVIWVTKSKQSISKCKSPFMQQQWFEENWYKKSRGKNTCHSSHQYIFEGFSPHENSYSTPGCYYESNHTWPAVAIANYLGVILVALERFL